MPPTQQNQQYTTRKIPPAKRDAQKTRYSAPFSPMSKPSSLTLSPSLKPPSANGQARRASGASVATTCFPRDSLPTIKPSSFSPAPKPLSSPSLATKPLPAAVTSPVLTTRPSPVSTPRVRPEWIAPPGKHSPPPTQIPTPKFVISKRKNCSPFPDTKSRNSSDGLGSIASGRLDMERKSANNTSETPSITPKTFDPLFQDLGAIEVDTSDPIVVTKPTIGNPSIPRPSENSGEERRRDLGLSFEGQGLESAVCTSTSPTSTEANTDVASSACPSSSISVINITEEAGKSLDTEEKEKRDSLSPLHDSGIVGCIATSPSHSNSRDKVDRLNHHLCCPLPLSSSSPLPLPSPSQTHPYVSGIHILPSCTSGSLTHRLTCGHLVLTTRPEVCAHNCVAQKTTFATAKLKAQGFVACVRNLDEVWKCPCCVQGEARNGKEGEKCVGVLSREMLESGNREDEEVCR